ncbi:hypothetical protein C5167_009877 [Papaver somniferum]|uniref:Knottin scorpion toxin-like domain-containing protein n=1 Tax=Papaver somniferum TaxID=3469 RepID=A0A4Y7K2Q0_PAPSO|nr:hypothetical protein C5167_009877 [Papaver somniferum]
MASGKVTAIACLVLFMVFCTDFNSVMASTAKPACCQPNHIGQCNLSNKNDMVRCNDYCISSCRGGECKIRGGKHVCWCYC